MFSFVQEETVGRYLQLFVGNDKKLEDRVSWNDLKKMHNIFQVFNSYPCTTTDPVVPKHAVNTLAKVDHKAGICCKKSGAIGKVSSVIFFYESHSYIPM